MDKEKKPDKYLIIFLKTEGYRYSGRGLRRGVAVKMVKRPLSNNCYDFLIKDRIQSRFLSGKSSLDLANVTQRKQPFFGLHPAIELFEFLLLCLA